MSKYDNKKYRILEILSKSYSHHEMFKIKKEIPNKLNISQRTFKNWMYLRLDDTTEISYSNLFKLAKILNTTIENLLNFEIEFDLIKFSNTAHNE